MVCFGVSLPCPVVHAPPVESLLLQRVNEYVESDGLYKIRLPRPVGQGIELFEGIVDVLVYLQDNNPGHALLVASGLLGIEGVAEGNDTWRNLSYQLTPEQRKAREENARDKLVAWIFQLEVHTLTEKEAKTFHNLCLHCMKSMQF